MASRLRIIFILAAVCHGLALGAAEHDAAVDLRIVVEVSADMQLRDADNLRAAGIELLIRSLPDDANAGVWSFARHTQKVARFGRADALWKQIAIIHVDSLKSTGAQADLAGALNAASWDLQRSGARPAHIVLFGNGAIRGGGGADVDARARQTLLADWATQLRAARIRVHTIGFAVAAAAETAAAAAGEDLDLLRQLAEVSGGLHRMVADRAEMQAALLDVQRLIAATPQARVDAAGRFQVAPGAERMTVLWFAADAQATAPTLRRPDGTSISRLSALDDGRWLLAQTFEIVTLEQPQPGWWQVQGPPPDSLSVFGEIDIRVAGVEGVVVPADDSRAEVELFSQGRLISHADFLDLLDVRAWLVTDGERRPLPVDRQDHGYTVHFVNLEDGAHDLEVDVIAPTFSRRVTLPFVVSNPLLVELVQRAGEDAIGWLQFSHPQVDYATVRTTAVVRKPPQIASLVPGERMPAGLWRVPLGHAEGIVELSFAAAGNYLNGKGLALKTRPHAVSLPIAPGERLTLRYDALGKMISEPQDAGPEPLPTMVADPAAPRAAGNVAGAAAALEAPALGHAALPVLPLWFVALISALNLAFSGLIWWLNKPLPLPIALGG